MGQGGNTRHPYYEFSAALVQKNIGYSYCAKMEFVSTSNSPIKTEYSLEIATNKLSSRINQLPGVKNTV